MNNFLLDVHFHPQLKAYNNYGFDKQNRTIWDKFNEKVIYTNQLSKPIQAAIDELAKESQANLNLFFSGHLKGGVISMYPTERPMFDVKPRHPLFSAFLPKKDYTVLGAAISGFPIEKVTKILKRVNEKRGIDYFNEELQKEYNYLINQPKKNPTPKGKGYFEFATDYNHFQTIINNSEDSIALIFSIEGLHSLIKYENKNFNTTYEKLSTSEQQDLLQQFTKNINTIKQWGNGKHTPFFVTFCHHYYNQLSGHAKSLSSEKKNLLGVAAGIVGGIVNITRGNGAQFKLSVPGIDLLLDQTTGMYPEGVEYKPNNSAGFNDLGIKVRDMLLSRKNGRRILIDTKHMSLNTRKEYIQFVDTQREKGDFIPIIASHTCCNGFKDFASAGNIIENSEIEKHQFFSRWSINLNDEEIRAIHRSNGLIGLLFHDGRMPGEAFKKQIKPIKKKIKSLKKRRLKRAQAHKDVRKLTQRIAKLRNQLRGKYTQLLMSNVMQIVRAINQKSAWDIISIGSDYDGLVDPLDSYYDVSDYPKFYDDMYNFFSNPEKYAPLFVYENNEIRFLTSDEIKQLYFGYSPQELAEKIAHKNLENFLEKYFNDNYLLQGNTPIV